MRALMALAASALLVSAYAPAAAADTELDCERIPQLLSTYFQKHIRFGYLSPDLRSRAVESYIARLDPSKTLFLESEHQALRASLRGIFHDVYGGDCARIEAMQADLVKRYAAMEEFVRGVVSAEGYAVDPDVMIVLDPEKRGYPADEEARRALITKLVHFQMSNYLASEEPMEEAKRRLVHRYELMSKRASELTREDAYSIFVDAFASSLDPHSHYLSAEAMEDFQIDMRLSLDGIGVALSSRDGYSVVEKVIPGGATDRLGVLEPKDKVIGVAQEDGEFVDVIDMDLRRVVRLIRGKRGTKVHLRVLRQGESTETFTVTIVRDMIKLEERSAKLRFEELPGNDGETLKLAVIELPSFYGDRNPTKRQSSRDVRRLLEKVNEAGADGLLLDLSRNGGGLLETAVEIAGFFIDEGGVVAVKGSDGGRQVLRDGDGRLLYDGPMVVLTSRVSASASEIVAGALRDYDRAVVVGDDHTFGKGTVQSMVSLPRGLGALKVTTALFFRPGGASTQHAGVESDVILPSLSGTDDFGERHQKYSLPPQHIEPFHDPATRPADEPVPWRSVDGATRAALADRSAKRVETSESFAKIRERIAAANKNDGVVHVAEILAERQAAGDAAVVPPPEPEVEKGEDAEKPAAQQIEALHVLRDLIQLETPS